MSTKTEMDDSILEAVEVGFTYYHGFVLEGVTCSLRPGEMVALIGPNGSGKTTLIRLLSGVLKPENGQILLASRVIGEYPRREMAKRIAVVPQTLEVPYAFTTEEMVLLGRTPYVRAWRGVTRRDQEVVEEVMSGLEIDGLANRQFNELSGGERQKVSLAMALAQEPEILFLDEPTLHLDIAHQIEMLDVVLGLNQERRLTVLAAIHDLNLAALYFPRFLLMSRGRLVADGSPWEVLNKKQLATVFGAEVLVEKHPEADLPQILLLPKA